MVFARTAIQLWSSADIDLCTAKVRFRDRAETPQVGLPRLLAIGLNVVRAAIAAKVKKLMGCLACFRAMRRSQ